MDETQAITLAEIVGGEPWQSGGNIWLVLIHRKDGCLVVISDESICEYASEEDFENTKVSKTVLLS